MKLTSPPIEVGGQGRKTSITHFSTKRNTNEHIPPARGRKPLPLGEVSPKVTERASPARKSRGRSDRQAFYQSDTIAVPVILGQQPCPLSRACARQLPQRGSPWHVGQLSSGRAKHNISEAAVLRCLGQRQLDKERCPEAATLCSKARPLAPYRASGVQ